MSKRYVVVNPEVLNAAQRRVDLITPPNVRQIVSLDSQLADILKSDLPADIKYAKYTMVMEQFRDVQHPAMMPTQWLLSTHPLKRHDHVRLHRLRLSCSNGWTNVNWFSRKRKRRK